SMSVYSASRKLVLLGDTEYSLSTGGFWVNASSSPSQTLSRKECKRVYELPKVSFWIGPVLAKLECSVGTSCAISTSFHLSNTPAAWIGEGDVEANAGYAEADASISAGVQVLGFDVLSAQ